MAELTTRTSAPTRVQPFVDDKGVMTLRVSEWINIVNIFLPIEGSGAPEGRVAARIGQTYIDLDATIVQSFYYIKQKADISGDRTMGWRLIL